MRIPNVFIIGAPKAGTTAMCEYLRAHPQVFFSPRKEPHYFAQEFRNAAIIRDMKQYLAQFAAAREEHKVLAEGSVKYLRSEFAVSRILEFNPAAKFIVMLRNPVEMAISLHEQILFNGDEDVDDFAEAWGLQSQRRQGLSVPTACEEPLDLQYGDWCLIGRQLERVLSVVERDRIMVIFFEDFIRDVRRVYADVLKFVDIEPFIPSQLGVVNKGKKLRSRNIKYLMRALAKVKRALGLSIRTGLLRWVDEINAVPSSRRELPAELRRQMNAYFADDIRIVQRLTGRDLSHWM